MARAGRERRRAAAWLVVAAFGAVACRTGRERQEGPVPAPERVTIGAVSWFVDYGAALAVAREQDKALWVHFGENPG